MERFVVVAVCGIASLLIARFGNQTMPSDGLDNGAALPWIFF